MVMVAFWYKSRSHQVGSSSVKYLLTPQRRPLGKSGGCQVREGAGQFQDGLVPSLGARPPCRPRTNLTCGQFPTGQEMTTSLLL